MSDCLRGRLGGGRRRGMHNDARGSWQSAATMAPAPHGSLPPRLWLDNVDALLNEPVYKSVMYQRLESCSSEQDLVLLEVWSRNIT